MRGADKSVGHVRAKSSSTLTRSQETASKTNESNDSNRFVSFTIMESKKEVAFGEKDVREGSDAAERALHL